jgi:FKBP-type peptidyl-prolyl cis-trans isomerase
MKKNRLLLFLLFVGGCSLFHKPTHPYKGFSTTDNVTYFKYCDMGTTHKKMEPGSVIQAVLSYSKMNDSVFLTTRDKGYPFSVFLTHNSLARGSTYERHLLKSDEGDSLIYIVPVDSVFQYILHTPIPYFLHKGDMMKVHIRVSAIMDSIQYIAKAKAIREYRKDMDMQEQLDLLHYATANNIPDSDKRHNIYILPLTPGNGPAIQTGSLVSLAYRGSFLNGRMFDSVPASSPLQFRCGDTAQMIPGLEIGIKMMCEGEKAKIIIPSQLAFGENGSSTGIVPPYTSVLYEVTILKVINGPVTKN